MAPQLVGLKGLHWGQTLPLVNPEITIGREVGNTIVCDGDSRVSRQHARLINSGGSVVVEDLGSSNGTFVNNLRIPAPTPLKAGDELKIGGQSYRFEAETPATPYDVAPVAPPMPGPSRPREVSRGEGSNWNRGTERIYSGPHGDMRGCMMPNLPDLSGCLKLLLYLLIALVVVMLIGGLLMLAGMGLGALGGLGGGAGAGGGGGGTSAPPGGGSQPTREGGQGPPPAGQEEQKGRGIRVVETRISSTWHPELKRQAPRVLVTWENLTDSSVRRVWAYVATFDRQGNLVGEAREVLIYDGKAVRPGGRHEDSPVLREGFDPPQSTASPVTARLSVTRYE